MSMYLIKGSRSLISSTLLSSSSSYSYSLKTAAVTGSTLKCYNHGAASSFFNSYRTYSTEVDEDEEDGKKKKKKGSKDKNQPQEKKEEVKKDASGKKIDQRKLLKIKTNKVPLTDSTTHLLDRTHQPYYQIEENDKFKVVKREQLKEMIDNGTIKEYTLIDLRDPKEFFGDYPIKESQNMPMEIVIKAVELDEEALEKKRIKEQNKKGKKKESKLDKKKESIEDELNFWEKSTKLTSAQWKDKFGFPKFDHDSKIIFYSANNGRSVDCANMAIESGYTNVHVLEGGIRQWNKYYGN